MEKLVEYFNFPCGFSYSHHFCFGLYFKNTYSKMCFPLPSTFTFSCDAFFLMTCLSEISSLFCTLTWCSILSVNVLECGSGKMFHYILLQMEYITFLTNWTVIRKSWQKWEVDQSGTVNSKKFKNFYIYQEQEISKKILYSLKVEIPVNWIEKAKIFLYSLETEILALLINKSIFFSNKKF